MKLKKLEFMHFSSCLYAFASNFDFDFLIKKISRFVFDKRVVRTVFENRRFKKL